MQRFKQMKEMHGSSSRDDRQKREQQRQEKEMAKFAQMYTFSINSFLCWLWVGGWPGDQCSNCY